MEAIGWREMPCLLWEGRSDADGYGITWTRVPEPRYGRPYYWKKVLAHHMTYLECFGPLTGDNDRVGHHCDNPPCRQPLHLFQTTHAGNMQDMARKRRDKNGRKTHCDRGHPLSGDNLRLEGPRRRRRCIACDRDKQRAWQRAKRARMQQEARRADEGQAQEQEQGPEQAEGEAGEAEAAAWAAAVG